jgi:hypothetical protein
MRLPRVRFSVRMMMIAVAIAALTLGANDVRLRRERYLALRSNHDWSARGRLRLAESHASVAAQNEREAARMLAAISSIRDPTRVHLEYNVRIASNIEAAAATERAAEQKCRTQARYHDALRIKYERAARYPWILVEPDPPEPP